ncbi:MAG: EamA/RhaT family transporter, partial [Pseudomonadota bacterium]
MAQDRPMYGIALMLGFCVTVPFGDAFAKLAGATLPLAMLMLARLGVQSLLALPLVMFERPSLLVSQRVLWW